MLLLLLLLLLGSLSLMLLQRQSIWELATSKVRLLSHRLLLLHVSEGLLVALCQTLGRLLLLHHLLLRLRSGVSVCCSGSSGGALTEGLAYVAL